MDFLSNYDYELPPELIAQTPLVDRAASRMLVLHRATGEVSHEFFRTFPNLLDPGDVLVVNETRVTALRLKGHRQDTGGNVELLVLRQRPDGIYTCLAKPARRLLPGVELTFARGLGAVIVSRGENGERTVRFTNPELLAGAGRAPLPPYIHDDLDESERYQTVYSRSDAGGGSAAAPTAGLHFTPGILSAIKARGVSVVAVSLDVGIDTFRPVSAIKLDEHVMHGETCSLSSGTADAIANCRGRVVAVGTTTARTLETFARLPGSIGKGLAPGSTVSKLFLRPGSEFLIVDALLTNFHMPRTTMLMMLSALAGRDRVMKAYAEAIREEYRFLSFGDAMFIV